MNPLIWRPPQSQSIVFTDAVVGNVEASISKYMDLVRQDLNLIRIETGESQIEVIIWYNLEQIYNQIFISVNGNLVEDDS